MVLSLNHNNELAPELQVVQWFNTDEEVKLRNCRNKVIVLHAFQMLCPGCVLHGLPQTQRIFDFFSNSDVMVIGLHTVFEHHQAMTPVSLESFLYGFKYTFPVGVDIPDASGRNIPLTMKSYGCQGTPSLILIDKKGYIRRHYFGPVDDMRIGSEIAFLLAEKE